jgi:hypothetical protein
MSTVQVTNWFSPNVKPVRKGIYEILGTQWAYWNGKNWSNTVTQLDYEHRDVIFSQVSNYQNRVWRGITM